MKKKKKKNYHTNISNKVLRSFTSIHKMLTIVIVRICTLSALKNGEMCFINWATEIPGTHLTRKNITEKK